MIKEQIRELIFATTKNFSSSLTKEKITVEHPTSSNHGDYSTSVALVLSKELKKKPLQLAGELVEAVKKEPFSKNFEKIEIAPPGFINFWFTTEFLVGQAEKVANLKEMKEELFRYGKGRTMVIDYSAPNIAKPFGIGHLRSTNIGQAIYNLYRFLGWKVIGDNHLGDWGTQFGKLIVAIKNWWKKDLKELTVAELEKLYVQFHQEAKKNEGLEDQARAWFKKLEEGDEEAKRIWQVCVEISLAEFKRIYQVLGVEIDEAYGESFYHYQGWMDKVLQDAQEKGFLKESQGAKVIQIPGFETPAMLVKSDGGTTYLLRDLATIKFRMEKWQPDKIVYEVGSEQKFHFQQIFAGAEMLGYIEKGKLVHLAHGLIRWPTGKFSTRQGKTIHLEEVLFGGIERATKLVEKSQTSSDLSEKEKERIAEVVGVGGVKFNDLKQEPGKDIIFDWEKILAVEGYSSPYLQYTYARGCSVLEKGGSKNDSLEDLGGFLADSLRENLTAEERDLLRAFYQLPEVVLIAAENLVPHYLCQYLFDLCQRFNLFYQKCRIIDSSEKEFRLFLTKVTTSILKTGLNILGIEVLEKM